MAEHEGNYLRQCLDQGICPVCKQLIVEKFGSGKFEDGVFCSLGCYGEWNKALLTRRHKNRVEKGNSDE
jgi:hypothetical protein